MADIFPAIRVDKDLWAQFYRACEEHKTSPSAVITHYLRGLVVNWKPLPLPTPAQIHTPPDEPCTCVPGTVGWAQHHGAPALMAGLPEACYAALESFAEDEAAPGEGHNV
jgi:hypothetical protein